MMNPLRMVMMRKKSDQVTEGRHDYVVVDETDTVSARMRGQAQRDILYENIVKTQRNSTQLKTTLKQLALELDIVVTCSTHPTPLPQTFQPLLDQLES